MMVIRVLIIDDKELFLRSLQRFLTSHEGIEVVGAFGTGLGIKSHVDTLQPDVVITDLEMPDVSGITVIRELRQTFPQLAMIALTFHDLVQQRVAAEEAGAHAFVTKAALDEALIPAINTALRAVHKVSEC